jgi:hypothetical protein
LYPRVRVDKLHPDGSPRAAWEAYRIGDHDGAIRLWAPARTPRIHVNGHWVPDGPILTTWKPGESFVVSAWEESDATELYADIVREVMVTPTSFAYVDLYVDTMLRGGRVWSKDEELLSSLTATEASRVLAIRDDLLKAMSSASPPFRISDPRWRVSAAVRALAPGVELAL